MRRILPPLQLNRWIGAFRSIFLCSLLITLPVLTFGQVSTEAITRWATYLGGVGDDGVRAIAVDDFGHVYVAGRTTDGTLLGNDTTGQSGLTHQPTFGGGSSDAFLAKFAPQGSMLWCTYFGGAGDEQAVQVVLTEMSGAYLVGHTTSVDSIATDTLGLQTVLGGGHDLFIAHFTEYGLLNGASYFGGPDDEYASGAALDALGRLLVCGQSNGPSTFATSTPIQPWNAGTDGLLVCFNSSDSLVSGTYFGGEGDDDIVQVAGGDSTAFVLLGNTSGSTGLASSDAQFPDPLGGADAFIVRMDTNLNVMRATYFGGAANDRGFGLTLTQDAVILAGETYSDSISTDTTTYQPIRAGNADGFIALLDTDLALTAFTYFGGSAYDAVTALRTDAFGRLYAVGITASDSAISALGDSLNGPTDAFALRFDSLQTLTWSRYIGDLNEEEAQAFDLIGNTSLIAGGRTSSPSGFSSEGHQMDHGGGTWDGYAVRMDQETSTICEGICTGTSTGYDGGACNGVSQPLSQFDICLGDSIQFIVFGGALGSASEWMWYADNCGEPVSFITTGDTITLYPTVSFTLNVRAEGPNDVTGCKSLPIIVHTLPEPVVSVTDTVCAGALITVEGSGAETFTWAVGDTAVTGSSAQIMAPLIGGLYEMTITATNVPACSVIITETVFIRSLPDPTWIVSNVTCYGAADGALAMDSADTSGPSIVWQHDGSANNALAQLPEGTYIAALQDAFGCEAMDTLVITAPPALIDSVVTEDALCGDASGTGSVYTTSTAPGLIFEWSESTAVGPSIGGLVPGEYAVNASDSTGCTQLAVFTIAAVGSIQVDIIADTLYTEDGETTLQCTLVPFDSAATIQWTPDTGLDEPNEPITTCTVSDTTLYIVLVTSPAGCIATDTVLVIPDNDPPPTLAPPCGEAFLPDIFSPNGDGQNDGLCLFGRCYLSMEVNIYDRWGQPMYSSSNVEECWDGTANGQRVPAGKYPFTLLAERTNGEVIEQAGTITVVR